MMNHIMFLSFGVLSGRKEMLHLDWVRELFFIIGISIGTCLLAIAYAALEKVFPFLKGGLGRMK
jgi:hypothetical protein